MQQIKHDIQFEISIGQYRDDTKWPTRDMLWSEFAEMVSKTIVTKETVAEYNKLKKEAQDKIKDVGGFVGGSLAGGSRKITSVRHRQLLTLDLDFASPEAWEEFTLIYSCAALVYSTHKHTPEKPRLRLVIPVDRELHREEYEAVARRIAGDLNIEYFDPTTFQVNRLMYWPSTSADGEFYYRFQDGEILCADEVLSAYKDWKNVMEWPVCKNADVGVHRSIKMQGDPLEKPGLIGAFCRTYDIHEAIETFLSAEYKETTDKNRYTFTGGSTSAGLVVYNDKFAYSNHGTDPCSGKCVNAFDLVRLHKFGDLDMEAKTGTVTTKLPSYASMCDFAGKDPETAKLVAKERRDSTAKEFDGWETEEDSYDSGVVAEDKEPYNEDWILLMDTEKKSGAYLPTIHNIYTILKNDEKMRDRWAYNDFEKREVFRKNLPWRDISESGAEINDADLSRVRAYIERTYKFSARANLGDAIANVCRDHSFHPVRKYLSGLTWDGQPRIRNMLTEYLGAEPGEYTAAVMLKFLCAAVARIMKPGTKFDHILVLVGAEGQGKSSLAKKLGGAWFSDSLHSLDGKDGSEQVQGVWIIEMAELASLGKAKAERVKAFITTDIDRFRQSYGIRVEAHPRQCVFFGTTNEQNFLTSITGNRRFWPVKTHVVKPVKHVLKDMTDEERNQIWAEAVVAYKAGEPLMLTEEIENIAHAKQEEHLDRDQRIHMVEDYLNIPIPKAWHHMCFVDKVEYYSRYEDTAFKAEFAAEDLEPRTRVSVMEVWCECFGENKLKLTPLMSRQINDMLRQIKGWELGKRTQVKDYGNPVVYRRKEVRGLAANKAGELKEISN